MTREARAQATGDTVSLHAGDVHYRMAAFEPSAMVVTAARRDPVFLVLVPDDARLRLLKERGLTLRLTCSESGLPLLRAGAGAARELVGRRSNTVWITVPVCVF